MRDYDITRAAHFAAYKHWDQKRKYTGEPYINHCKNVAALVETVTDDVDMICAAWLHDTVEDTGTGYSELCLNFGNRVSGLVEELTDRFISGGPSRSSDSAGNRAYRKAKECERLAGISPEAQTIKLADLIDNTSTIVDHDPNFAKIYLQEKAALLEVLRKGDERLQKKAQQILEYGVRALSRIEARMQRPTLRRFDGTL